MMARILKTTTGRRGTIAAVVPCLAILFTSSASWPSPGPAEAAAGVVRAARAGFEAVPSETPVKPDFSGVWVINPQRSQLDARFKAARGTITIVHKEPRFHFERAFAGVGKDERFAYDLTTDGKEVVAEAGGRTDHSRLTWEGDVLVYSDRIVLKDGREATDVVRYSLRDDGRTFVAEEKFRGPVLKYDNLWVADRKGQ